MKLCLRNTTLHNKYQSVEPILYGDQALSQEQGTYNADVENILV